jgi:hypothetical protein
MNGNKLPEVAKRRHLFKQPRKPLTNAVASRLGTTMRLKPGVTLVDSLHPWLTELVPFNLPATLGILRAAMRKHAGEFLKIVARTLTRCGLQID